MKTTKLTLNQAYALIIKDESQRSSPYPALAIKADANVMQAGQGTIPRGKTIAMQAGYPGDFKAERQVVANSATGVLEHEQQTQMNGEKGESCDQVVGHFFTEDHYKQILNMLNKDTSVPQVNMAGSVQVNHEPFPADHDFLQQEDHEGLEPASTSHPQEAVVSPIVDSTLIPGVDNVPTEEVQNGHAENEYTQGETSTTPSLHDIVSEEEHDAMYLPQDIDILPEIEPALASEELRRSSEMSKSPCG
ncbi:hypothetical protein A4A49_19133 [Nicotiana attenuata]|uniref:Uncharacterized protein n=1 Tax=Nicotiana attenuata TaxID=49451 RepID=A0A314L924_NICAT|nr:hypothetical protein A4A49_19133 [Nicotiana attenuata]